MAAGRHGLDSQLQSPSAESKTIARVLTLSARASILNDKIKIKLLKYKEFTNLI